MYVCMYECMRAFRSKTHMQHVRKYKAHVWSLRKCFMQFKPLICIIWRALLMNNNTEYMTK